MARHGMGFLLAAVASSALLASNAALAQPAGSEPSAAQPGEARSGSAVIRRDAYGTPTIFADDSYSLFYGYGYALAEDRLFQIESVRRALIGRSAEVFGPEYLDRDIATLSNFDPEVLRPQIAAIRNDEHRAVLDGMTAGINARIAEVLANPGELMPRQFLDYGFEPAPWTDFDIVSAFTSLLLIGFADNSQQLSNLAFRSELIELHGEELGARIFESLRWREDPTAPTTVQRDDQAAGRAVQGGAANAPTRAAAEPSRLSAAAIEDQLARALVLWNGDGPDHVPLASNSWLANGERLADGDSLLFSGPQVGDRVPSMIYAASLRGAGLNVTGSTYPGLPYFHFGTNGVIAWGRTAGAGSVTDIYEETLHPTDSGRYRFNGEWREMERRVVTIPVRGQDPVEVELFRTVHGPVIVVDEDNRRAYAKKRSWEDLVVQTMFAYYEEMKATTFDEWAEQIYLKANNQSQYYADREGNIGYIQAGRYPIRAVGHDIQLPTPGDGSMEWRGFQPPEENARVFNPGQGYIANWNNRPSPDVPNSDIAHWARLDRVDAIIEQFEARASLTTQQIWDINRPASHSSEQHRYFVPLVEAAIGGEPADSRLRAVARTLVEWDGQMVDPMFTGRYTAPGEAVFYEWLSVALTRAFTGAVPESYLEGCGQRASYNCPYGQPLSAKVLYFALTRGETGGPVPAHDFLQGADRDAFIRETLAAADQALTARFGPEISGWLNETRPKVWVPSNPRGLPWAGAEEGFRLGTYQNRGTMNALYVFRNGEVEMCDAVPPGQSGFIAPDGTPDPNYANQWLLYTSFNCRPRAVTPDEIVSGTVSERRLTF